MKTIAMLLFVFNGLVGCMTPCDEPTDQGVSIGHGSISEMPAEVEVEPDGAVTFSFGLRGVNVRGVEPGLGIEAAGGEQEPGYNPQLKLGYDGTEGLWTCNAETQWWEALGVRVLLDGGQPAGPTAVYAYMVASIMSDQFNGGFGQNLGYWDYSVPTTLIPFEGTGLGGGEP